jgi:predicted nucleotide-binding protein
MKAALVSMGHEVFIVHGHDEAAKQAVSRFIEKLGFTATILHEQPNAGRTIIEKIEAYSNVGFAIILLTPDDIGGTSDKPDVLNPRARQNVILELGYFFAKLGRQRVCALYKENSNCSGIIGVKCH